MIHCVFWLYETHNQNTQWDFCGKFTIFLLQYKTKGLKATCGTEDAVFHQHV